MGEKSKRTGEIGESIVENFLKVVGWKNPMSNFDIPSVYPDKHEKKTNGIDFYFSYRSPMIANTLDNIIISSKFSGEAYKLSDLIKTFKDYYVDLAMAIESFKYSDIRNNTINAQNKIENTYDKGVLFWINNVQDNDEDLILRLQSIDTPKGYNHDGIYLVDNKRMDFIFYSMEFADKIFKNGKVEFVYFQTGQNGDNESLRNGDIMPVQYINSNILPLRIENSENSKEIAIVICTNDAFSENDLEKLMGLIKNISNNFHSKAIIAFPDYNELNHAQIVELKKQQFNDSSFTSNLVIENYNNPIRK